MGNITMVGLGAMGTALALALVKGGRDVTVWNRSPQKMAPVVAAPVFHSTGISPRRRQIDLDQGNNREGLSAREGILEIWHGKLATSSLPAHARTISRDRSAAAADTRLRRRGCSRVVINQGVNKQ